MMAQQPKPRMRTAITTSLPASTKEMLPRCRMAATWLFKKSPSFDLIGLKGSSLTTSDASKGLAGQRPNQDNDDLQTTIGTNLTTSIMIKRIVQPQRWSLLAQSRRSPWRPSPAEPATESCWWPCDLVIAAGVGGNFSGGGNILVDQEFWWISSYLKRGTSINSEYMFIFGTSIQSSLSSVPSTCGSVLERDVNEWSMLFSENYILINSI